MVSVGGAVLALLTLSGCGGIDGKIANYDSVAVWPNANPIGSQPEQQLTTLTPITVDCYEPGKTDASGYGYGATYKISYDGGSGYIDASTSIMSDDGEVTPEMVSEC